MAARGWAGFLALLLTAGPLAAQQDRDYFELLLDVRVNRGPTDILLALADDSTVLLATRALLALVEVRVTDVVPGRHLRGVLEPAGTLFWFDGDSNVVRLADIAVPVQPGAAVWRGDELYVRTGLLQRVLDVTLLVNRAELTAQLLGGDHLPAVRRLERARKREEVARLTALPPPALDITPPRRSADGAVLDWRASGSENPFDEAQVQLGLGAQLLGGSMVVEHSEARSTIDDGTGPRGVRTHDTRASWIRAFHASPALRQIRLGEVVGTGRIPRFVQGVVITNEPFLRPANFSSATLEGTFDPGWEVELYRTGQLAGFVTTDPAGGFQLTVPVQYGPNPVELVAYGPRGEVVRRERTFEISLLRLAARRFEYGIGGGRCAIDPCEAALNVDLRYGFTDAVTARLGVDRYWRDTLPDLWHPYAALTGQATRSIALTVEGVAHALVTGRVDVAPTPDLQAALVHTRFDSSDVAPLVGSAFDRHRTDATLFYRPGLMDDQLFVRLTASRTVGRTRTRDFARVGVTTRFLGTRIDAGLRYDATTVAPQPRRASVGVEARFFHVYTGPFRWLRRTLFLGEAITALDTGLTKARLGVSRPFGRALQIDLSGEWQRGRGFTLDVGITTSFPFMRAVSRNRFNSNDGVSGAQVAEGSLLWDPRAGRIEPADGRSLGRAGLTGQVFVDLNGNGAADEDEPGVPGVRLHVGPQVVRTDSAGRFAVWDLVPFEIVSVAVDTLSIDDPLWVPVAQRFTFRPDPNSFTPLPLPLVQAGEVSGRVMLEPSGRAVRGARVVLRHVTTDDVYTTTTFSDGTFYLLGVRPGAYEAAVDPEMLDRLGLRGTPARFTIGMRRDEVLITDVEIRLTER